MEIVKRGLDDRAIRDGASGAGNREKRDVNTSMTICGRLAGIEAKNQKKISLMSWWEQTEKLELLNEEPLLCIKPHGRAVEDTLAVIRYTTLLDILKASENCSQDQTGVSKSDVWELQRAREGLRKSIKVLEKYV